ncbi:MAG: transglycosylase SLT domain-containing protein [Pseudomonadota bacterium]
MATVPKISAPSVAPAAAPNVQLQNTQTAELLTVGARQQQQFGQALTGLGTALEDARIQALEQGNALLVDDSVNQLNEVRQRLTYDPNEGYTALKGVDAMGGAQPLAEDFTARFDDAASKISTGLKNDRQRQMFQMRAGALRSQFYGSALAYESQQQQAYKLSVRDATTADAANSIALEPGDEASVRLHTYRLRSSIEGGREPDGDVFIPGSAQMQGKSAAWAKEKADEAVSAAYATAIAGLINRGDLDGAAAFRERYGPSLQAKDMLKIDGTLQTQVDQRVGQAVAKKILAQAEPALQPTDEDRAFNILIGTESGGKQLRPNGTPLTSSAGAIGIAQVMPETAKAAAKRMGIPWDEQRYRTDPAYNRALGRNEFVFQLKNFNGDLPKAFAAYNAGPKWVEGATERAAKAEPGTPQADWFWQLNNDGRAAKNQEETRNYVEKNMREYRAGGGAPPKPTLAELQAQVDRALPNASPLQRKTALEQISGIFHAQEAAFKQRGDEAVAQAQREIEANGGNFVNIAPKTRAALTQYAPGQLDNLMSYASKLAAGQPIETDWTVYASARRQAIDNPKLFAQQDLRALFPKLAPAQREQLLDLQTKAKDPKQLPDVATFEAQLGNAHDLLEFRASDQEKKGMFDSAVTSALAAEQVRVDRKLTYEERQKVIDRMMVPGSVPGLLWGSNSRRLYEVTGTEAAGKFAPMPPAAEKEKIVAALKRAGKPVTEEEVTRLYRQKVGL